MLWVAAVEVPFWVEQAILASHFSKLLAVRQQLANTFFPLPSISHLIILVDPFNDALSVQTLRVQF